ncbi:MAG: PAS domain-containing protein, partial [Nodosilinea sp.]
MLTVLCFVDAPPLADSLATSLDYRVVHVTTAWAAGGGLEQLLATGDEVALAIAAQTWLATKELQAVYDHFPQALTVVLDTPESLPGLPQITALAHMPAPGAVYRRLVYPGPEAELVFTVSAALGHYRQGQQLAREQAALAEAHHRLGDLEQRLSTLAMRLDWGLFSQDERTAAEKTLGQSQRGLAEAQRIAQLGSWELDVASQTMTWSAELFRIHGLDPAQLAPSYDQWRQTIFAEDWLVLSTAIEQAIAVGTPYEIEHRIAQASGEVRYVLSRGEAVYNDQNQVVQLRGTVQDRTAARLAELALRQSEAQNRAMLAAIPDLMIVMGPRGEHLDRFVNGFAGDVLPIEAGGAPIADRLPAAVAYQWLKAIRQTLATGTPQVFDQQLSFGDRVQHETVRMVPYQAGQVLALVRDVSASRQLEHEHRQAEAARRASEARLEQIAARVREGFFVFDAATQRYDYLSPAYAAITGVALETIKTRDQWLSRVHPDDYDRVVATTNQHLQGEATDCEYRYQRPDGEVRWLRSQAFPITDEEGTVESVVGTVDDITSLKQSELCLRQFNQELEQAVAKAEAASRAKSTFLATMSHELRTPLNAILGFAQLMARDAGLSKDHHQSLNIIHRSGESLLTLINDVLEMAKVEAGQAALNASCFTLDILLNDLYEMFCLRTQDKGLTLTIDRHPALPSYFRLDVAKLRQVLINLLSNAIKFTLQGQVTLRVTPAYADTAAQPPGTTLAVTFTVSDTGAGLAVGDRDRLFEPFVQVGQG